MESNPQHIPKGAFKFLIFTSRPWKGVAFLALLCVIVSSTIGPLIPYVFKRIIDSVNGIPGFGPESVMIWVGIYVAATFLEAMTWRGSGFAGMRWSNGVRASAREELLAYLTKHSHSFFSDRFAGAIGNKVKNAADGVRTMVGSILWNWIGFFFEIVIGLWLAFHTNRYTGLFMVAWILIIAPINYFLMKKRTPIALAAERLETKLQAETIDMLTNMAAVRDYARRGLELMNLNKLIEERRRAGIRNWSFGEWVLVLNTVIEGIFTAAMMLSVVYAWNRHLISAGDIVLILGLIVGIRSSLAHIGAMFNDWTENLAQTKEGLLQILDEHDIKDISGAKNLIVLEGEIVFDKVAFKYETQDIFTDLNLTIKPGERVGLVGRSGAGKSTLMKLLMRQYDINGGSILVDGQDIAKVKQESLRRSVAVVPQDPLLFHRTLKENIAYGKLDATDAEIEAAAEQAQAHRFIEVLPKKYETLVGERGVKLSGGERQRVAIARAFLKDAKILLLDEATSALDSESEKMIQAALEKLMEGKTVIAIAHRLSTLRAMDRVIVMDKGQVVEDGSHEELIKLGGIYAELWSHQAGGFITED